MFNRLNSRVKMICGTPVLALQLDTIRTEQIEFCTVSAGYSGTGKCVEN